MANGIGQQQAANLGAIQQRRQALKDFAFGENMPMQGTSNLPVVGPDTFTEEDLKIGQQSPNTPAGMFAFGEDVPLQDMTGLEIAADKIETSSDDELNEAAGMSPAQVQTAVAKGRSDAVTGEDSLSNMEKIALASLALMPVLGGLIEPEGGAEIGLGAAGLALQKGGETAIKVKELQDKKQAEQAKLQKDLADTLLKREDTIIKRKSKLQERWEKNKTHQSFRNVQAAAQKLAVTLRASETGIGDTAAIINLMKILDEGSVVREGEQALIARSQGLQSAWTQFKGMWRGKRLTPEAIREMKRIGKEMALVHLEDLKATAKKIRAEAVSQGVNPDEVVTLEQSVDKWKQNLDDAFKFEAMNRKFDTTPAKSTGSPTVDRMMEKKGSLFK